MFLLNLVCCDYVHCYLFYTIKPFIAITRSLAYILKITFIQGDNYEVDVMDVLQHQPRDI